MMFFGLILAENKLSAIEIGIATLGSERPDAYAALLNCLQNPKRPLQTVLGFNVGTVLMYGFGGQIMPRVQIPAVTPKRKT